MAHQALFPGGAHRRLQIHQCLGRSGLGEVHRAALDGDIVSVKLLRKEIAADLAGSILQEEDRLLAALAHPRIARWTDLVRWEDRLGIVRPFLDGERLDRCLLEPRPPLRTLLTMIGQVAGALDAAWRSPAPTEPGTLGLVHGDLKPSNVLLGRSGEAWLLDFGVATAAAHAWPGRNAHRGRMDSYPWLAPERFQGEGPSGAADVYALGCILFEGIAGERFVGDQAYEAVAAASSDPAWFARFREHRLGLVHEHGTRDLVRLLTGMLHPHPAERPSAALVARRCLELGDELDGPTLAQWCASRNWSPAPAAPGALDGQVLFVRSWGQAEPASPRRSVPSGQPVFERPPPVQARGTPPRAPLVSRPPPPRPQPVLGGRSPEDVVGPALGELEVDLLAGPALGLTPEGVDRSGPALGDLSLELEDDEAFERELARAARRRWLGGALLAGMAAVTLLVVVAVPVGVLGWASLGPAVPAASVTRPPARIAQPDAEDEPREPEPPEPKSEEPQAEERAPQPAQPAPEPAPPAPEPPSDPLPPPDPPPQPTASSLASRGWGLVSDRPSEARALFQQAIQRQPGYPDAEYGLGYLLLQEGRNEEARPHLCRALRDGGTDVQRDVRSLLGRNGLSC